MPKEERVETNTVIIFLRRNVLAQWHQLFGVTTLITVYSYTIQYIIIVCTTLY